MEVFTWEFLHRSPFSSRKAFLLWRRVFTGALWPSCFSIMHLIASFMFLSESCHSRSMDAFRMSSSIGPLKVEILRDRVTGLSCANWIDRIFQKSASEGGWLRRCRGLSRRWRQSKACRSTISGGGSNDTCCKACWILLREAW